MVRCWRHSLRFVGVLGVAAACALTASSVISAQGHGGRKQKPVVTADQDNPDRQEIYQADVTVLQFEPLEASDECLPAVPEGKRLVIEHVTARVRIPTGQEAYAALKTQSLYLASLLPLTYQLTEHGHAVFVAAVPAKLRVDAGGRACFLLARNIGTGQGTGLFTVSGYLIDMDEP
jgi:hypothetical protein